MEFASRKSIHDDLKKYCHLAKEHDYIEVCKWINGEGWDITLNDMVIPLTYGQLDAINYLTNALQYEKV